MIGWVLAGLATLALLIGGKVVLDLANKEIQGWLFDLPYGILRFAARRLPDKLRRPLYEEPLLEAELSAIYRKYEKKPITALTKGLRYSIGHVVGLARSARILNAPAWTAMLKLRVRTRVSGAAMEKIVLQYGLTTLLCALAPVSCVALGRFFAVFLAPSAIHNCVALFCLLTFGTRCWAGVASGTFLAWVMTGESVTSAMVETLLHMPGLSLIFLLITGVKVIARARWEERILAAACLGLLSTALIFLANIATMPGAWAYFTQWPHLALYWEKHLFDLTAGTFIAIYIATLSFPLMSTRWTTYSLVRLYGFGSMRSAAAAPRGFMRP